MATFFNETIHIMPGCIMHLHGHWNKVMPLMKPFILVDFSNALNFAITLVSQPMTFEATISHVGSVTIT
jgi:hypothetical protein